MTARGADPESSSGPTTRSRRSGVDGDRLPTLGSWLFGDTLLARRVGRPLAAFVRIEAAAGVVLALAVVAGLAWANSPWKSAYSSLWSTEILVRAGPVVFDETLQATLNDAAMVLFFFAIGLEIKRELVTGSLRHPKAVALPVAAAIGGMLVPAGIYAAMTAGTPAVDGWAIPMATDTALALGVALLAGPRLPRAAMTFLLTLAVVDDIAVILVIAAFYTDHLHFSWLAAALGLLATVVVLQRARVWYVPVYIVVGTAIWYCTFRSGIHATMAGVMLGLLTPASPLHGRDRLVRFDPHTGDPHHVRHTASALRETVSVAERLQHVIRPWVGFVILPLFALANAGITLSGSSLAHAAGSRAALAVMIARVVGKPLGIIGFAWLAYRLGMAHLPGQLRWAHVAWIGILGAVGFTVAVYVAALSFTSGQLDVDAKLAVIATTVLAALAAAVGLRRTHRA